MYLFFEDKLRQTDTFKLILEQNKSNSNKILVLKRPNSKTVDLFKKNIKQHT